MGDNVIIHKDVVLPPKMEPKPNDSEKKEK